MMVTFPLLLALLDYWPLRRLPFTGAAAWMRWVLGKLPYMVVAGALALITARPLGAHADLGAIHAFEWSRLTAVPWNYIVYLKMLFWPTNLAVLYPAGHDHPLILEIGSAILLLAISFGVWRAQRPVLLLGWTWFVLTLVPVSGILRIGPQDLADRYLYLPGVGLLAAVVWGTADAMEGRCHRLRFVAALAVAAVLGALAYVQVRSWKSSLTLWQQAAAVTRPNATMHTNLGNALLEVGRDTEADTEFEAAIKLNKYDPRPYVNQAVIAQRRNDHVKAIALLRQALTLAPEDPRVCSNLGSLLDDMGESVEARQLLEKAVQLRPELAEAWLNLGVLRAKAGELIDARMCFEAATRLKPGDPAAEKNLRLVRNQLHLLRGSLE